MGGVGGGGGVFMPPIYHIRVAFKTVSEAHGEMTTDKREHLPDSAYAFPKQRKEPLTDASHVRNALARFDQVEGVSDEDRELAFANIKKAAKHFGVDMQESNWKELTKK